MPHLSVHFLIARRAAAHWRTVTVPPPFDIESPRTLNAFLHGALGPDIGYFPGGPTRFSDLAHTCRSVQLVQNLIGTANTEEQHAFAWGWATHIVADAAIHPVINAAAARLAIREHDDSVPARRLAHIRIELGIDAVYFARAGDSAGAPLLPYFRSGDLAHIAAAAHATYAWAPSRAALLAGHYSMAALSRLWLWVERRIARESAHAPATPAKRWHRRPLPGALGAFGRPAAPSGSLLSGVAMAVQRALRVLESPPYALLSVLPNYDLDTGLAPGLSPLRDIFVADPFRIRELGVRSWYSA